MKSYNYILSHQYRVYMFYIPTYMCIGMIFHACFIVFDVK